MNSPAVIPSSFTISITETLALGVDMTAYLTGWQTVADVTTTLVDQRLGIPITMANAPTVAGNIVTQIVNGPTDLASTGSYLMTVNFTAAPSTNRWAAELLLTAVQ